MLIASLSFSINLEMDTEAIAMLAKGLYAQKKKEKVPGGSSKRAKVSASSSMVPAIAAAAFEVAASVEVLPTTKIDTVDADSMPSAPPGPSSSDQALKLSTEEETREEKKKKKAIVKTLLRLTLVSRMTTAMNEERILSMIGRSSWL
ncbi:hypothetical protein COCNU_scaffold000135G000040 [Cocos nucifera]|nr:hypothetical protein [Cocos nucifera]